MVLVALVVAVAVLNVVFDSVLGFYVAGIDGACCLRCLCVVC